MKPLCSFPECKNPSHCRGWCGGHYTQVVRGRPMQPLQRKPGAYLLRDARGRKECPSCEQWLPEGFFGKDSGRSDGLNHYCLACARARSTDGPEAWASTLKSKYSISTSQYEALLDEQGGACAICKRRSKERRLSVDHDHACCAGDGSCGWCIRGLLCGRCNSGLGFFGDNIRSLEAAILYLKGGVV